MSNQQVNGIVIGVVCDLNDPERLGRVRVTYPHLGDVPSDWARIATLMAGPGRGSRFLPEVGDEVLVVFEHGDPRWPYVLGGLWSQADPPPPDDGQVEENNWRYIESRSGHIVRFDDTQGGEKIELIDKDGQRRVVIDSANRRIQVQCDQGDVEVSAPAGSVTVEATTVEIKATGTMSIEAGGTLTIKGAIVNIN